MDEKNAGKNFDFDSSFEEKYDELLSTEEDGDDGEQTWSPDFS